MILRLVFDNAIADNELRIEPNKRCPYSCPSVEVERDLAALVARWPGMSSERKQFLVDLAMTGG